MKDLVRVINEYQIKSIAIPPLGCGNGDLKWNKVKTMMDTHLSHLNNVEIVLYEPNAAVKEVLQKEQVKKDIKLTNGRAMILAALFKYERYGEAATVFAANKLAYFLQESGENLKLDFKQYAYGPYAQAMDKVLYALNGKYLKGLEQMTANPFEPLELNYERYAEVQDYVNKELTFAQKERLSNLFKTIDGFESALSLEILSSTHFILKNNPSLNKEQLVKQIQWTTRKKGLINSEYVDIAYQHLKEHGRSLQIV